MTVRETLILDLGGDAKRRLDDVSDALKRVGREADKASAKADKVGGGGAGAGGPAIGTQVSTAAMGAAMGAVSAGVTQAIELYKALGAFAVDAMKKVVSSTQEGRDATQRMDEAYQDFQLRIGEALLGADGGVGALDELTATIDAVSAKFTQSGASIGSSLAGVVRALKIVGAVLVTVAVTGFSGLAMAIDVVVLSATGLHVAFAGIKLGALKAVEGLMELAQQMGADNTEALNEMRERTADAAKEFEELEIHSAGATEALVDFGRGAWDVALSTDEMTRKVKGAKHAFQAMNEELDKRAAKSLHILSLSREEIAILAKRTKVEQDRETAAKKVQDRIDNVVAKGGALKKFAEGVVFMEAQTGAAFLGYVGKQEMFLGALGGLTTALQVVDTQLMAAAKTDIDAIVSPLDAAAARMKEASAAGKQMSRDLAEDARARLELAEREGAAAQSLADAWEVAFQTGIQGSLAMASSMGTMFVQMQRGRETLGGFADAALAGFGSMFASIGQGLVFTGLGLEAIKSLSGGLAIAVGVGLMALGATMSAFGDSYTAPAAAEKKQSSEMKQIAREFMKTDRAEATNQTIVVQIGTREIAREVNDMQRRRQVGGRR